MEVKNAGVTLQLNTAAIAVDNMGSDGNQRHKAGKAEAVEVEKKTEQEEESVKVSISAAGMRKSLRLEQIAAQQEKELATASEIDEMMKKMDGLSSQIINGNFSMQDRLNFQNEIKKLTNEIDRLNGDGISFTKYDNVQLSQKINDLTRTINEAAVYHRSATALFMVKNQQKAGTSRARLDIAI